MPRRTWKDGITYHLDPSVVQKAFFKQAMAAAGVNSTMIDTHVLNCGSWLCVALLIQ